MRSALLFASALLFFAGCTPIISKQALRLVDRNVTFTELRQDPLRYSGQYLLLGGEIAGIRNTSDWGEMEVVEFKTDEEGRVTETATSGGRFIALVPKFLDPDVYRTGVFVTIVGQVEGQKVIPVGKSRYPYPVLSVKEMHLWNHHNETPPAALNFEIGFGTDIR